MAFATRTVASDRTAGLESNGETDEPGKRRMPDRPVARCDRRLVVAPDYPRRADWPAPFWRVSEKPGACQEHPGHAAAHAGGPRHFEAGACVRRQRLSGICADGEGTRRLSRSGRPAAVVRRV